MEEEEIRLDEDFNTLKKRFKLSNILELVLNCMEQPKIIIITIMVISNG